MRAVQQVRTVLFVAAIFSLSSVFGADVRGKWVGGLEQGKDWTYLQAHFESRQDNQLSGTCDAFVLPFEFVQGRKLTGTQAGSNLNFEVTIKSEKLAFDGRLLGGSITGAVLRAGRQWPFRFDRVATISPRTFVGFYELSGGRLMTLHTSFLLGTNFLGFIDFTTGRTGGLFPRSQTEFFVGPGVLIPYPPDAVIEFTGERASRPSQLTWREGAAAPISGRRIEFREEEITFTNRAITLAGTLIRPPKGQRHPAVIFVPASTAAATREMVRPFAEYFAFHGVASLIYDKRGVGSSGGDWLKASFDTLAEDALAGVTFLHSRAEIDRKQIGLWGASQGGWIVALAASRSSDIAFIISQSGPGVTPERQETYRSESFLRADGYSEAEIQKAMALVAQRYQWSRTGEGWDALYAADRAARKNPWYPYIGALGGKDNPFWDFWALIRDYDPTAALEKVRCPVLALFGDRDTFVPIEESVQNWKRGLAKAGNQDVTVKILPNADHSLIEVMGGGLKELPYLKRFVPAAFHIQKDWLLKHVDVPR